MTDPTTRDPAASLPTLPEPDAMLYWSRGGAGRAPRLVVAGVNVPPDAEPYYTADDLIAYATAARAALLAEVEAAKADAARWRFYRASKQTQYMLDVDSAEAADAAADAAIIAHHGARTGESNG